jgi:hypothetical protein
MVLLPTADNDYGVASKNIKFIPNFTRISPVINHMKHTDMTRPTCISFMCCVKNKQNDDDDDDDNNNNSILYY